MAGKNIFRRRMRRLGTRLNEEAEFAKELFTLGFRALVPTLFYVSVVGFGGLAANGTIFSTVEPGHLVLGGFVIAFGIVSGIFELIMGMDFAKAQIQGVRLVSMSGWLVSLMYLAHGYLVLAGYVGLLTVAIFAMASAVYRYQLNGPSIVVEAVQTLFTEERAAEILKNLEKKEAATS